MTAEDSATESIEDVRPATESTFAIRNALKLGASLLFTWGISLGIRLLLPRSLGPARFGSLNFADGFSATTFILVGLGADTHIRKDVSVRPAYASEFYGGLTVLRVGLAILVLAGMALILHATGRSEDVTLLVMLFGVTQFFVSANSTLSAILHAKGRVGAMSVLAVATKIIWAGGVLVAIAVHAHLWAYAAAYLASESVETFVLYGLAQQHVDLRFRVDPSATKAMLAASLPYYLHTFASTAYGKLDISLLEFAGNTTEVGWYGAANAVASLTLLASPLIGWVLMPMFARAATRSRAELDEQVRRALELIMSVAIPIGLVIYLGAAVWIRFIFGAAFAPAVGALRVLAPMSVIMYVSIIYFITLMMLGRPWALVFIGFGGLAVNVAVNLAVIGYSMRTLGPGGGGTGCAVAMLATEVFVTGCMLALLGRTGFDRRSLSAIAKSLVACAFAVVVDDRIGSLGPARLALDGAVYAVIVLSTGAVRPGDILAVVKDATRRRGEGNA